MANLKLQQFIQNLPVDEPVKQAFLQRLEAGAEEEVKREVALMLREAGLTLSAIQALNEAESDYNKQLKAIEKDANSFIKTVAQALEKQALAGARQAVS